MATDGVARWQVESVPATGGVRVGPSKAVALLPDSELQRFSFSRDGELLAVAGHKRCVLIDWQNPSRRVEFSRDIAQSHVSVSPDHQWLAAASSVAAGVTIWDARDGSLQRRLIDNINAEAVISPDAHFLATATAQECVLWDTHTWQPRHRWPLNLSGGVPVPLAFSHDGRYLAVAANRTAVRLLETGPGTEAATLMAPLGQNLESLVFSADGRYLAGHTGARVVHLWNLQALRRELAGLNLDW
jgi:WD40 repeat protein